MSDSVDDRSVRDDRFVRDDRLCPVCSPAESTSTPYAIRRVLVGVKPSEHGLPPAATHARMLGQSAGAEIILVSVVPGAGNVRARARRRGVAQARAMSAVHAELEQIAQSMRDWGANVETSVVCGTPACDVMASVARPRQVDLIVVAAHEQGVLGMRFSDTDWQLMRVSPVPLLLVKDPTLDGYDTILAAVDPLHDVAPASGLDAAVMAVARAVGSALGTTLRVVSACLEPEVFPLAPAFQPAPGVFCDEETIGRLQRDAVEDLAQRYGVPPEDVDVEAGPPADVITAVAGRRGADLVVLGARSRRNPFVAALGGTAEAVAAALPCDVLLVPPFTAPSEVLASERAQ